MLQCSYSDKKYLLRYKFFELCPLWFYKYVLSYKYKKVYKLNLNWNFSRMNKLSEKLQWLKLYDSNPEKTKLADKILLKSYVEERIPELKTAKLYKIFDSADDIDFSDLPDTFVIKTNHSWCTNILVEDKNNITLPKLNEYKDYFRQALKINYAYWSYYELHYKNIVPKVFAEEYYGDRFDTEIYQIYCFNGIPEFIIAGLHNLHVNKGIFFEEYTFDTDWNSLDFGLSFYWNYRSLVMKKPDRLSEMLEYSKKLSANFKFVRCDFAINKYNNLYLSEMTFTPYSGFLTFYGENQDLYYGNKLKLK